ncbi:hypothetical protein F8O06_09695 [Pseudoclavibacter sp. CFCC 14310]|uniref:GAP1-N2 domain-containing protein n=1 Tax=Pseudoclavibacter sp. CFCC 14310 TaxID=2615180 RepID=UPI001300F486|nr:hypothetical protein [Pseudoclavibacter sp. CFCC 14310]KAB1644317.1 hypothetical protein F8O06_09695 [Pseudoclavibacter sp. CFCC 14310]
MPSVENGDADGMQAVPAMPAPPARDLSTALAQPPASAALPKPPKPLQPTAPRWAQLTYGSMQTGSKGGWQVKETSGSLSEAESAQLVSQIVTSFNAVRPLPKFPTADDRRDQWRRLVYAPISATQAAWWHAVECGADITGRPGNVFTHAVLDRDVDAARADPAEEPVRPIELWRSPDLLTPFGVKEVDQAALPEGRPVPRATYRIDTAGLVGAFESFERLSLLCVLLDAVHASLRGGSRVVLGVDSPDDAAFWVEALSRLTSPVVTRRFGWSLFERAQGLEQVWHRGVHLAAVPLEDLDAERRRELIRTCVVIGEHDQISLGGLGGSGAPATPHQTADGLAITVTAWSEMTQLLFSDPDEAVTVLDAIDQVADRVGDLGLTPEWPLAATIRLQGGGVADDAIEVTSKVVASSSPDAIRDDTELFETAVQAIDFEVADSADKAWKKTLTTDSRQNRLLHDLCSNSYLRAAVRDPSWILQSHEGEHTSGAPVAAPLEISDAVNAAFLEQLQAASAERGVKNPIWGLRVADFVMRAYSAASLEPAPQLRRALADTVTLCLTLVMNADDDLRRQSIVRIGSLSAPLTEELVYDALAQPQVWPELATGRIGLAAAREGGRLVSWLTNGELSPLGRSQVDKEAFDVAPIDREVAIMRLRSGLPMDAGVASLALHTLITARPRSRKSGVQAVAGGTPAAEHWWQTDDPQLNQSIDAYHPPVSVVDTVDRLHPGSLPPAWCIAALACSPADDVSAMHLAERLVAASKPQTPSRPEHTLAHLRQIARAARAGADLAADQPGELLRLLNGWPRTAVDWELFAPLYLADVVWLQQSITEPAQRPPQPANPSQQNWVLIEHAMRGLKDTKPLLHLLKHRIPVWKTQDELNSAGGSLGLLSFQHSAEAEELGATTSSGQWFALALPGLTDEPVPLCDLPLLLLLQEAAGRSTQDRDDAASAVTAAEHEKSGGRHRPPDAEQVMLTAADLKDALSQYLTPRLVAQGYGERELAKALSRWAKQIEGRRFDKQAAGGLFSWGRNALRTHDAKKGR